MSTDLPEGQQSPGEFEASRDSNNQGVIVEFALFVSEHKAWWMIPILLALAFLSLFVVLGSTGAAPFIYTLF